MHRKKDQTISFWLCFRHEALFVGQYLCLSLNSGTRGFICMALRTELLTSVKKKKKNNDISGSIHPPADENYINKIANNLRLSIRNY